jgi:hypothetical protein
MRKNITSNVLAQSSDDLIDFRVSDTFRRFYAAQGLTFPPGNYPNNTSDHHAVRICPLSQIQELNAAQEARGWRERAFYWESRCARLEHQNAQLQDLVSHRIPESTGVKI